MSRLRCYIKPFNSSGAYATDYIEVTEDVDIKGLSNLSQKLDNSEFDVGVYRFGSTSVKLNNSSGRYSDINEAQTIFKYKRSESLFKIVWESGPDFICGFSLAGDWLTTSTTIFEGLIQDKASATDIKSQDIKFALLTTDAILEQVENNFTNLNVTDLFSEAIYTILNQTEITDLMTVSASNINVGVDLVFDDIADLENKTAKETLATILELSNSVLFVRDSIVYVQERVANATDAVMLYGQASDDGIENILKLNNVKSGKNKMLNFITWTDTTLVKSDSSSISKNGINKKEIDNDLITDPTKRESILDAYLAEFKNPKQELNVTVGFSAEFLGIFLLDKIKIDYPTIYYTTSGREIPIYGLSKYNEAYYPNGQWAITIAPTTEWKVLGRVISLKTQTIEFLIKEL